MKPEFKYVSLLIVFLLMFNVCACASKSTSAGEDNSFAINTDDFDMPFRNGSSDQDATSDTDSSESSKNTSSKKGADNKGTGSSKETGNTDNSGNTDTGSSYYNDDDEFKPMEIPSRKNAHKLSNTFSKMQKGETIKVAYFGGSVTRGHGASNDEKTSWRALTTAYLKSVSSGSVTEINAAYGGTGSYFGASRFEYDVSSKKPDLVFIEFLVNDGYSGLSAEHSQANLEYMINNVYDKNPYADIVLVLVTNTAIYGWQTSIYKAQVGVANYYNIPIVDFGGELYNRFEGSIGFFKENFNDSVHPNDKGYKLYADIMTDALKELLVSAPSAVHKKPANMLSKNGFTTVTNIQANSFGNSSKWIVSPWKDSKNKDYHALYPRCLAPKNADTTLNVTFTGNTFGYIGTINDGCTLTVVVDGSRKKVLTGKKSSTIEYPLFTDLDNTAHTVTVTVTGNTDVEIAAFVTTK